MCMPPARNPEVDFYSVHAWYNMATRLHFRATFNDFYLNYLWSVSSDELLSTYVPLLLPYAPLLPQHLSEQDFLCLNNEIIAAWVWWSTQEKFLIERKSNQVSLFLHPKIWAYKCIMNICRWAERLVNYFWCLHKENEAHLHCLSPRSYCSMYRVPWWLQAHIFKWNQNKITFSKEWAAGIYGYYSSN